MCSGSEVFRLLLYRIKDGGPVHVQHNFNWLLLVGRVASLWMNIKAGENYDDCKNVG